MKRYALIIGCDEYTNFSNICFCYADAELMRSVLTEYCDYENSDVEFVTQYRGCDENSVFVYGRLEELARKAENGDTILFYFAGHGAKEGEKGYLLLADSSASDYSGTALDLKRVNDILSKSKANSIIILDACHSGINARNIFAPLYTEAIQKDTGCITLAACSENQESNPYVEKEQGVFTYFLAEEIKNRDIGTELLLEQLKVPVCKKVEIWAKENCKNQTPTLTGSVVGNVPFAIRNSVKYEVKNVGYSARDQIIKNIESSLLMFGQNADAILESSLKQENTDISTSIIPQTPQTLLSPIIKLWMKENYNIEELNNLEPDKKWKIFGDYYAYKGIDSDGHELMVMVNNLNKMNYSSVIHAFKNLDEVRKYYESFGVMYRYHQIILIKKEREAELDKMIKTHAKIKALFQKQNIVNEIVYLEKGKLTRLSSNNI